MISGNYMDAINEAKDLLSQLLNDPDHGKLIFEGEHDVSDLIVTGPRELEDLISGTVLAINNNEWMALSQPLEGRRCWQNFRANKVATSEELYIRALRNPTSLICCHRGL